MKLEGRYLFALPIAEVYQALQDEALIREALPGTVRFEKQSSTRYLAEMTVDIPRYRGHYAGWVEVLETEAPSFYRLHAEGTGPGREVTAEGRVELTALGPEQTEVRYVGKTDAFDDMNRFVRAATVPVAIRLANRGLEHLERVIQKRRYKGTGSPSDHSP